MAGGDARTLSQDAQEALRIRGVKLLVEEGWTQVEVGGALGVSDRVVGRWLKRYRQGGWAGLAKRRRGRRRGEQQALSAAQQQRIVGLIAGRCPDQLQIPGLLWTRSAVQQLIERETGIAVEITTVGRYLRHWGFTLKRPVKRALEQDPVVVQAWLEEVYPALERRAKAEGALILWGDESGIACTTSTPGRLRATRSARGGADLRPAGRANMTRDRQRRAESFRVFDGRFTAAVFIDFLDRLMRTHQGRKLYLVVDNHSTHHAKKVRQWLDRDGRRERLELVFLPAYSPELNPDENLNQDIKRHLRTGPERPTDRPRLVKAMRAFLRSLQRQPARVAAYFNGEHVRLRA